MVWICFVLLTWFIFVSSGVAVRYFLAPGKAGDDFSPSTARPPPPGPPASQTDNLGF